LATLAAELPTALVAEWRRRVATDLAERPLSSAEASAVGADPLLAYGTTLLVVLVRDRDAVALQLGDGDVVTAWADGEVRAPMPPEPRNVGGQTTSLCLSDAASSFRTMSLDRRGEPPALVLLSSDGYGNSFADPQWHQRVLTDVLEQRGRDGVESIAERLPRWTAESARVGGDDTTVAVVFHTGARFDAPAVVTGLVPPMTGHLRTDAPGSTPTMPVGTPAATGTRPARRTRLSLVPALSLVVVAALAGLAAGWTVGSSGASSETVAATTVPDGSVTSTVPGQVPTTIVPTTVVPTTATTAPSTDSRPSAESPGPASGSLDPTTSSPVVGDTPTDSSDVVIVNTGHAVVELDLGAVPPTVTLHPQRQGGQILTLLTPAGLWEAGSGGLTLQPDGANEKRTKADPGFDGTGWGLGSASGLVVAVWTVSERPPATTGGPATSTGLPRLAAGGVLVYRADSGELQTQLPINPNSLSSAESAAPIQPDQEEGTP
jgi:hypothetical protein